MFSVGDAVCIARPPVGLPARYQAAPNGGTGIIVSEPEYLPVGFTMYRVFLLETGEVILLKSQRLSADKINA